jgi:glycosyltransferase involved in cell wall biosynthesis
MTLKSKLPYFSVIIPCLNEENFLPHLLTDLNSQNFSNFEVIVVDGNSVDKTAKIVLEFSAKYPLYLEPTTIRNVSFQRNLGAKIAHGKIFVFFDADTRIPPNYLKKVAQAFEEKHPHFLTTYINVDSQKVSEKTFASLTNFVFEAGKIFKTPLSFGAMQAVKRDAFFDVGGYDEATKFGEDSQLFQDLYQYNYKFLVLSSPCYTFSLRRFRSEGLFKSFVQSLQLNFNIMLNGHHTNPIVKYEMGGQNYKLKKIEKSPYSKVFEPLFSKIAQSSPRQNSKLQSIFNRFFSQK